MTNFDLVVANAQHEHFAQEICTLIEESAKIRGTGIAKRNPEYIKEKMREGKAVIALTQDNKLVGFCYIETWSHESYVAHSGLIVHPDFRQFGLAKAIKSKAFELSQTKYPNAKIFGLTTSLPVMKINSDLGYKPVTFSELTKDDLFWKGCQSCVNYDILQRTERKHCLCTGMLYDPAEKEADEKVSVELDYPLKVYARWMRFKQYVLLKLKEQKEKRKERRASKPVKKRLLSLKAFF